MIIARRASYSKKRSSVGREAIRSRSVTAMRADDMIPANVMAGNAKHYDLHIDAKDFTFTGAGSHRHSRRVFRYLVFPCQVRKHTARSETRLESGDGSARRRLREGERREVIACRPLCRVEKRWPRHHG